MEHIPNATQDYVPLVGDWLGMKKSSIELFSHQWHSLKIKKENESNSEKVKDLNGKLLDEQKKVDLKQKEIDKLL